MKIILSRKGFDSAAGGYPSPIMADKTLLSIPIPDRSGSISYDSLTYQGLSYYKILSDLIPSSLKHNKERLVLDKKTTCHLDPDLIESTYIREGSWRGVFGQSGAAETHLRNNDINKGDIFLFFGWFRKTIIEEGVLHYCKNDKSGRHIIYGYLQVGEIIDLAKNEKLPKWVKYHPHINKKASMNRLYIASEKLSFADNIKGYGGFKLNNKLILTKEGLSRSKWHLPKIFQGLEITYHSKESWKEDYFQCALRGQEFVIEESNQINDFAKELILNSERLR
jgi:hypothetical protein